jgi:serine protease Do
MELMGLTLSPLSDEIREQLELPESARGLAVMDVDETSEAFEKGLRAGDVITEAGQAQVLAVSDLEERIAEAQEAGRKSILLLVRRAGDPRFVALTISEDE